MTTIPDEIRARAAAIKLAAFDVDGVLTDGTILIGADGFETVKAFNTLDGLGLKLLRENGVEVALITARETAAVAARARELGLRHCYQGTRDKLECLAHLCRALSITLEAVAYTGDDLPDLAPMTRVGLPVAVANAHAQVRSRAAYITRASGGAGAAREVCDLLLDAQGKTDAILRRFLPQN
jgi:3-deoxy-D-manno-octulosonate 8-phosphate phosphatase (KDO 8-P phosphatase)